MHDNSSQCMCVPMTFAHASALLCAYTMLLINDTILQQLPPTHSSMQQKNACHHGSNASEALTSAPIPISLKHRIALAMS